MFVTSYPWKKLVSSSMDKLSNGHNKCNSLMLKSKWQICATVFTNSTFPTWNYLWSSVSLSVSYNYFSIRGHLCINRRFIQCLYIKKKDSSVLSSPSFNTVDFQGWSNVRSPARQVNVMKIEVFSSTKSLNLPLNHHRFSWFSTSTTLEEIFPVIYEEFFSRLLSWRVSFNLLSAQRFTDFGAFLYNRFVWVKLNVWAI